MSERQTLDRHGPFAFYVSGLIGGICVLVALCDPGNLSAVAGGSIGALTGIYGARATERWATTKASQRPEPPGQT